ncbi:beta-lactamase [Synechococcus sp. PCC 7335]|uniref:serine hydrolase domain-containing protein n=1 Tax=Synechococcus sp. (strain ATCC 29403 / PCC 7335) TaxID=91464 RepID=UPI00017EC0D4|nr:serine hydrolase domain-containing protein [Synechococcus sp. PCC 7335]EDX82367.1 beta-lactamase [Synechococcus sp. PCC 7335]
MNDSVEQRIEQVINNILSAPALDKEPETRTTLEEKMSQHHTPGVSIAVVDKGEIDWASGFGIREAGQEVSLTPDTLFQAGSISKPIFSLAVLRLVQEGRLNLDEDVNRYLTSWKVPANGDWQPRVTLRHLLSHTAGTTVVGYYGYRAADPIPTTVQVLNGEPPANSEKVVVNVIPGLNYRYSGGGMTIAQQVLVDVLGKPFPDLMRELVIEPLGMTNSTFEQPLREGFSTKAATGHQINGTPIAGKYFIYPEMAAAGLWTTPTDLCKVGVELMKVLAEEPTSMWTRDTIQEMLCPQSEKSTGPDGLSMGLGMACSGTGAGSYFFHDGTNIGFVAMMRFYPALRQGAVVMLNAEEGGFFRADIMNSIGQTYQWPEITPPEESVVSLAEPNRYIGTYRTKLGAQFTILNQAGRLFLKYEQQQPLQIAPVSESKFFARAANIDISFKQDDEFNISEMCLSQSNVMTLGSPEGKQITALKESSI